MSIPALESACITLKRELHEKGFTHLQVRVYGSHLVVFTEQEGVKENRARLTYMKQQVYVLGIANHRGKWEPTPFNGTVNELLILLTGQFAFALADY